MTNEALKVVSTIAAKLASGQLTLESAVAYANSGELGDITMLPTLGDVKDMPCSRCSKEGDGAKEKTPHIFGAFFREDVGGTKYTLYRWSCALCPSHIPVFDTRCCR